MNRKERFTLDAAETVEAGKTGEGAARVDVTPSVAGPVLDGIPRQPGAAPARAVEQESVGLAWAAEQEPVGLARGCEQGSVGLARADEPGLVGLASGSESGLVGLASGSEHRPVGLERRAHARLVRRLPRPWRLFPTPKGTPFTFSYAAVLVLTSGVAEYADPALVHALHQGSSTDVAHLVRTPVLVLFASALWVAGGVGSPYALGFLLVLTALERRIGGWRTAGVFLLGHILATLATEVPVGLAVLAGHLPDSSLHRLDYGISFGVAASVGALAGLLSPWLRWPILVGFGGMLLDDLIAFTDPMTNWGHLMSLAIGVATWPVVRRWWRAARGNQGGPGCSDDLDRSDGPDRSDGLDRSEESAGRGQAATTVA